MNNNSILVRNEYEANRFAAKVMLLTIIFVAMVYVLNFLRIFIVPIPVMSIAMGIATVLLLIPAVIIFILKLEGRWIKYVTVSAAALMVASISTFLAFHVVIMYVYAIAIASLYFSRKLSWFAVVFSIVTLSLSQVLVLVSGGVRDENFKDYFSTIVYGVAPRAIQLLVLSLIFIALSKRTRNMLQNVVGAEEQKKMLDRVLSMSSKSSEVSNVLAGAVKQLSEITEGTTRANEQIAENSARIALGSEDTIKLVDEAAVAAEDISESFDRIASESRQIAEISQRVNMMTVNNEVAINKAVDKMRSINESTGQSKELIFKLGERSNEIKRIVEIIKGISGQTNLLALNAAIESARAGEQGKGFAVVASEIRALAEQSEKAAKDIANLINEVVGDTTIAMEAMDRGADMVEEGLDVINEAGVSFEKVSAASREMDEKVQQVSNDTMKVAGNGEKIVSVVHSIRSISHKSLEEIQGIAAASEQQLAAMQQVASSVDAIEKMAVELLDVTGER